MISGSQNRAPPQAPCSAGCLLEVLSLCPPTPSCACSLLLSLKINKSLKRRRRRKGEAKG